MTTVRVGVIQARPVYYDLPKTMEKALDLLADAHKQGAQLVTFGETWFPGYPVWLDICPNMGLWDHAPTKEVFAQLYNNALTVDGEAVGQLRQVAQDYKMVIVASINERVTQGRGYGTLYNSLLTIGADGNLLNHHRKLIPTYTERMVWGQGDAKGLGAVDTEVGRVGSLICWEHWMPLTRQAMHTSTEEIHIAVWPTALETHQLASRHYAFEGRTYVLCAGSIVKASDLPDGLNTIESIKPEDYVQRGGSAIIAPDGMYIYEPVYDEEITLIADLDLNRIPQELMALDVTGHYSRPDIFDFSVNRERKD